MNRLSRSPPRTTLGWIKDALTEHLALKFVCLVFACALVAYQNTQHQEKTRTILLALDAQLPNQSGQRELMTALPPNVRVTLQGSSAVIDELAESSPRVELDLRDGQVSYLRFTPELLGLPRGVNVKLVDPEELQLTWEEVIVRRVSIQASVAGAIPAGHEVVKLGVDPPEVDLWGPASLVQLVQLVRAVPFDVTGLAAGAHRRDLALESPPSRIHYVDVSSVAVTVELARQLVSVTFARLAVEVIGVSNAKVVPARVDITVRAPGEVIASLQPELVIPHATVAAVEASRPHGSMMVPVTVELTRASVEVQPPTVKVTW